MDRLDEALDDYKKLLELDPSNKEAIISCQVGMNVNKLILYDGIKS